MLVKETSTQMSVEEINEIHLLAKVSIAASAAVREAFSPEQRFDLVCGGVHNFSIKTEAFYFDPSDDNWTSIYSDDDRLLIKVRVCLPSNQYKEFACYSRLSKPEEISISRSWSARWKSLLN